MGITDKILGAVQDPASAMSDAAQWSGDQISQAYDGIKGAVQSNLVKDQWVSKSRQRFNENKYSFDQHCYPDNLMSEAYGGNYAIFYINISDDSKLNETEKTVELDPNLEPRFRSKFLAQPMTTKELITTAGVAGAAEALVNGGGAKGAFTSGVGSTIGTGAIGLFAPENTRSLRRLKTAIALHIPNQLSVRYGMQWSEEDTANLQAAGAISDGLMKALSNKGSVNKQAVVGAEAAASLALGSDKMPNNGAISAKLGIAANPKKEQTFKGVDFRKFTFEYQFFPRSSSEAQSVLNIIETFKLHMHPEFKTENQYIYIYPSEFDIIYYTNHVENQKIHRHTSCVLEEMSINYTPNGNFSVFRDGMPTQINISMSFRELMLLSKETVAGGF